MINTGNARILLSGASGLIGTSLQRSLEARRISLLQLFRTTPLPCGPATLVPWDPEADDPISDIEQMEGLDTVIHLSGANVSAHRWTGAYKEEIVASRTHTTRALVRLFQRLWQPPRLLLCASATGIYGDRGDEILTEDSPSGSGFLADTCRLWEAEADLASQSGVRVINMRFGVVLAQNGGALKQMLPFFRRGLGGRMGSGTQWMSWISLTDLTRAVLHLLDANPPDAPGTELSPSPLSPDSRSPLGGLRHVGTWDGAFNFTAPHPVRNADFAHALGHALHRPAILPVPAIALRAALGEMADEALLSSARALPMRLEQAGFHFEHPTIEQALKSIL
jgi:uncharacterized protein (TIGR01777 family)